VSTEENFDAELPEELKSLEAALRQLTPAAGQIDRDRLMYQAGRASVLSTGDAGVALEKQMSVMDRRQNYWPMATATLALLSITMGGLLWHATQPIQRVVYVEAPSAANSELPHNEWVNAKFVNFDRGNSPVASHADYFQLRNQVLTDGVDALPKSETSRSIEMKNEPSTLKALFQQWPGDDS
jgi:hypothetical protein